MLGANLGLLLYGEVSVMYFAQVSAFAKIMKHYIMIDQFEEEKIV